MKEGVTPQRQRESLNSIVADASPFLCLQDRAIVRGWCNFRENLYVQQSFSPGH
jgi:hypothetical protein